MQNLDYQQNTYIAVTLSSDSPYFSSPELLTRDHSSLTHVGKVGQLADVQLLSIPKAEWDHNAEDILTFLRSKNGVGNVDVQVPKQRVKRGGDEL